jgi:hypothetical protein
VQYAAVPFDLLSLKTMPVPVTQGWRQNGHKSGKTSRQKQILLRNPMVNGVLTWP